MASTEMDLQYDYLIALNLNLRENGTNGLDEILSGDLRVVRLHDLQICDTWTESIEDKSNGEVSISSSERQCQLLKNLLDKIESFLSGLGAISRDVGCVSFGQAPIRHDVFSMLARFQLEPDQCCYCFFDLRKEALDFFGETIEAQLVTMQSFFSYLGVEEGDNKLDVSELLANCVIKMSQKGHRFMNPDIVTKRVDLGISTGQISDDTIVRVRGLPWHVTEKDVADFFKGINIARGGIALCWNGRGKKNGEAFVRLENAEQRDLALLRHKHFLAGRYIEVYKASSVDFCRVAMGPVGVINVISSFMTTGEEFLVYMRGVPYSSSVIDVTRLHVDFLRRKLQVALSADLTFILAPVLRPEIQVNFFGEDCPVLNGERGVMMVRDRDGNHTGEAFVLFETEEICLAAQKKHKEKLGSRFVEVSLSSKQEMHQVLSVVSLEYKVRSMSLSGGPHPSFFGSPAALVQPLPMALTAPNAMVCIKLRGLPYSSTVEEIKQFLGSHAKNIVGDVNIIYNIQGKPSGEAFVQFNSVENAQSASSELHLKHLGERYIEIFHASMFDQHVALIKNISRLGSQGLPPPPAQLFASPSGLPHVQIPVPSNIYAAAAAHFEFNWPFVWPITLPPHEFAGDCSSMQPLGIAAQQGTPGMRFAGQPWIPTAVPVFDGSNCFIPHGPESSSATFSEGNLHWRSGNSGQVAKPASTSNRPRATQIWPVTDIVPVN